MKDQEGPQVGMKPARFYKTCSGCKWHKHTLVRSGNNPIYADGCTHETAPDIHSKMWVNDNLQQDVDGNIQPGNWCPFEPVNAIELV